MHHIKVYTAHDPRYNAKVIQGYKIEYNSNYKGEEIEYHRMREQPLVPQTEEFSFHFEDEEYITHLGVSFGLSLDRIEFTTNHERHFKVGGSGGGFHRIPMPCDVEGTHPRVISFGVGLGPHDVH